MKQKLNEMNGTESPISVGQNASSQKSRVTLVRCESYEPSEISAAVRRGIALLGGIGQFARSSENILLKPNLLSAHKPSENVTTHPEIVKAVAEVLIGNNVTVTIGDSTPRGRLATVYRTTGIQKVAEDLGLTLADFETGRQVSYPAGIRNKQFTIAEGVLKADGLFSLPKLKTHHLTRFTATIKNQYGCIPGILKPALHVALPGVDDFSKMLVDLNLLLRPRLCIMDAIEAMDGNGPSSGTTYHLNLLAFSADPVALDSVACRIIDIKPEMVRTNYWGAQFGLGKMDDAEIEILGEDISKFHAPDFKIERQPEMRFNEAWRYRRLKNYITHRPVIDPDKCKMCGECVDQCPQIPKALSWRKTQAGRPPVFDYLVCIRCFCCQEVCPHKAIDIKVPVLRRIIDKCYKIMYGD